MPETSSRIEIFAPPGIVYATLWDAGRYPEFLTDVIDAQAHASSSAAMQTVRLVTRLVREIEITLSLQGEAPSLVTWRLVDGGDWLERFDVEWWIEGAADGRSVMVAMQLDIEFCAAVPEAVVQRLFDFSVPTMLRQIRARAELTARRVEAMV